MKASACIQDLAPPNCWQHPALEASPKQHARQDHKPNHQQIGIPQTPQIIPPHTALPIRGKNLPSPTRTQAQIPPDTKPTQDIEETLPDEARDQKQKELWSYSPGKGNLKHSKLDKVKRQRTIVQMNKQGKNP